MPHKIAAGPRSAVARRILLAAFCALPVLSFAEIFIRGSDQIFYFRDYVLGALVFLFFFPSYKVYLYWTISLSAFLVAAVILSVIFGPRSLVSSRSPKPVKIFRSVLLAIISFGFLSFWWMLADWKPAIGTIPGAAGLVWLFGFRSASQAEWLRRAPLVLGISACATFLFVDALEYQRAIDLSPTRLFDQPSYDAEGDAGGVLAACTRFSEAVVKETGRSLFTKLQGTGRPQRLAFDSSNDTFYIADYLGRDSASLYRYRNGEMKSLPLPGCRRAIDVAVAPEAQRLYALCSASSTLHVYDLRMDKQIAAPRLSILAYAVRVDEKRSRVLVTTLLGNLMEFDASGRPEREKSFGIGLTGLEFDRATGHAYVAHYLAGDLIELDERLKIIRRVPAGLLPRDVAYDDARKKILVGNYVGGTMSVFDANGLKKEADVRVGWWTTWPRLRGGSITRDGAWIAADGNGLWQFDPERLRSNQPVAPQGPAFRFTVPFFGLIFI